MKNYFSLLGTTIILLGFAGMVNAGHYCPPQVCGDDGSGGVMTRSNDYKAIRPYVKLSNFKRIRSYTPNFDLVNDTTSRDNPLTQKVDIGLEDFLYPAKSAISVKDDKHDSKNHKSEKIERSFDASSFSRDFNGRQNKHLNVLGSLDSASQLSVTVPSNENNGFGEFRDLPPAPVPEPSTMLLMGAGLAGLVGYNRKRNKKN